MADIIRIRVRAPRPGSPGSRAALCLNTPMSGAAVGGSGARPRGAAEHWPIDVSFVLAAIRARAAVVALCAVGGLLLSAAFVDWSGTRYEATAVLAIRPPTTRGAPYQDPGQYVLTEVARMTAPEYDAAAAAAVESSLGTSVSTVDVDEWITIEPVPVSEMVDVVARAPSSELAAAVANAFAHAYLDTLPTSALNEDAHAELTARSLALQEELGELDHRIATAVAPYLPDIDQSSVPLAGDLVVPADVSRRDFVRSELRAVNSALGTLELDGLLEINSEVVAEARAPTAAVPIPRAPFAAGVGLGALIGACGAIVAARRSRYVVGVAQAASILGVPIVARVPEIKTRSEGPGAALAPTSSAAALIDVICQHARGDVEEGALEVAVTGTRRGRGVSTLATAMAGRFATWGGRAVLVDADVDDPAVIAALSTRSVDGAVRVGTGSEIVLVAADDAADRVGVQPHRSVGGQPPADQWPTVIDCGPLLASTTGRRWCHRANAVIVVVSQRRQDRVELETLVADLDSAGSRIIPVLSGHGPAHRATMVPFVNGSAHRRGEPAGIDHRAAAPRLTSNRRWRWPRCS